MIVQKDVASLHDMSAYSTVDTSKFDVTHAETATEIAYSFALKPGEVMQPSNNYTANLFAVLFRTTNEVRAAKDDTFVLNGATATDGQAVVLLGNIVS